MAWAWYNVDDQTKLDRLIRLMNVRLRALTTQVRDLLGYTINVNTFSNGATAPSVSGSRIWKTNNSGATSITAFSEGTAGQEILVWAGDANTTIVHNATSLKMLGGANVTMGASDTRRFATIDGSNWREVR